VYLHLLHLVLLVDVVVGDENGVEARVAAFRGAALGLLGANPVIVAQVAADGGALGVTGGQKTANVGAQTGLACKIAK